jgi:hypothetical protein
MVVMQYTAPVRAMAHPISEGFFSDEVDNKKETKPGERSKFKLSLLLNLLKEGDHRNQAAIETWATKLHEKLAQALPPKVRSKKK